MTRADVVLGPLALIVALSFVALANGLGAWATFPIAVAFNTALNLPHQWLTWQRAGRSPGAWRIAWACVAVCWIAVLGLAHQAPEGVLHLIFLDILTYWGLWHLIAQHAGISVRLGRAAGSDPRIGPSRAWYLALFLCGVVRFHALDLLDYPFGAGRVALHRIPLPMEAGPWIATFALGTAALLVAWRLLPQIASGGPRLRYEAATSASTLAAFFLVDDLLVAAISATALHAVQYAAVVIQEEPQVWRRFAPLEALAYALLVTAFFAVDEAVGRVVFVALVATHYTVDAVIWRRGHPATPPSARPATSGPGARAPNSA